MICRIILLLSLLWPQSVLAANDAVTGLRVVNDRWPDAGTPETFGRDAIRLAGAETAEQQAIAVWRFIQQTTEVGTVPKEPAYGNSYVLSPEKLLNIYGVHWCDGLSRIMSMTWRALGYRADKLYKFGHTLADIHYRDADGVDRWHVFDLSQNWFVYDRTGSHIASADELALDHSLLYYPSRTQVPAKPSPMQPSWVHAGHLNLDPHPMGFNLGTGDRVEFLFGNEGKPYMDLFPSGSRLDFEHGPYPITYGNGRLISRHSVEKIANTEIFAVGLPYVISEVFLNLSGRMESPDEFLRVSLSTDGGDSWHVLWQTAPDQTGTFRVRQLDICPSFDPETQQRVETPTPFGRYDYLLKVDRQGAVLDDLQTITVFQHNLFALPMLWPGANRISVRGSALSGIGVRATYRWDDARGVLQEDVRELQNLPADYIIETQGQKWEDVRSRSLMLETWDTSKVKASAERLRETGAGRSTGLQPLPYPTDRSIGRKASRQPQFDRDAAELEAAMEMNDRSVIADRIVALGALRDARSAVILEKVIFKDATTPVWHKILACQALYQSIGKAAASTLLQVLEKDARVAWAAPQGKWSQDAMWLHTVAAAAAILADIGEFEEKEKAADLIAATLQDKHTARPLTELHRGGEIGWGLIRALGSLGGKRHVPLLTEYLTGNVDAATVAAEALIKIGDEALLPAFLTMLDEAQYSPLRLAAIQGIGQFGQPHHGKKLYPLLKDRDEACRGASARALGQLGDPNAIRPLQEAVRKESFPWVRQTMDDSLDRLNQIHGGSESGSLLPSNDSKKGA